jgi:chitinase
LYSTTEQKESTDNCVQALLRKKVPAEKLVIGAAFYARIWKDVPDVQHGLYQSGLFKSGVDFFKFEQHFSPASGFVPYWDAVAKAPYMYNATTKEFATFDNPQSIQEKVTYLKKNRLGGIMFWELRNDSFTNGLLGVIHTSISASK